MPAKKTVKRPAQQGKRSTPDQRHWELESELAASRKTVRLLVEKIDELREQRADAVGQDIASLRVAMAELERAVRLRTRALTESEAQLRDSREQLHSLSQSRAIMVSVVAHELRTPLTGILGYLDLIKEGALGQVPESLERPITAIARNAGRLRRMVDDLYDLKELQEDRLALRTCTCSLTELFERAVAEAMPLIKERQGSVSSSIPGDITAVVDPERIHQSLGHLFANSLRHTNQTPSIHADLGADDEGIWVRVRSQCEAVREIAPEMLFEPFAIAHPAENHSSGPDSAGVGLYIARSIFELHGGELRFRHDGNYGEFRGSIPRH